MNKPRVFQDIALALETEVALSAAASHYLSRVLRQQIGSEVIIFNGRGGEYKASIVQMTKKQVIVWLQAFNDPPVEPPISIQLVQGLARGEKMDFIIQKAVELGVNAVQPVMTEYSNVKLSAERIEKRLQHWQSVAVSASEQSGRVTVPVVYRPVRLIQWLKNNNTQGVILSPSQSGIRLASLQPASGPISVLVGPEGGFSPEEERLAADSGIQPVHLGPRILRTETAPLAILSLLQYCFGDFAC